MVPPCPKRWRYGVPTKEVPKLDPLFASLKKLLDHGLTAGGVVAAFHERRVLPLAARRLWLDQMVLGSPLEGSQMSDATLSLDDIVRRVRDTVGPYFVVAGLDKVKMRPSRGYISLVSGVISSSSRLCIPWPLTLLPVFVGQQGLPQEVKSSEPPVPEDKER
jgi:hypothetical protein